MLSSRHITFYGFFAVLYYLLIMNWSWARVPDYNEFTLNLEKNTNTIRDRAHFLKEYARIEGNFEYLKDRYAPFVKKMDIVSNETDTLIKYIETIKNELRQIDNTTKSNLSKKIKVKLIIQKHRPDTLAKKIEKHISVLSKLNEVSWQFPLKKTIPVIQEQEKYYEQSQSTKALISILSAIENTLVEMEYASIHNIMNSMGGYGCWGDQMRAIAIADKYFALQGQKVNGIMALVMPIQENGRNQEVFLPGKGKITKVENGVAYWESYAKYPGVATVRGKIKLTTYGIYKSTDESIIKPDTTVAEYPWSFQYMVMEQGLSLRLDKTNICYVGVPNPISISVPGFDVNTLSLKVKNADVTQTAPGKFNIFFHQLPKGDTYAFVEGTNKEGTTSTVGSLPLKVTYHPRPIATIAGGNDGYIRLGQFKRAERLGLILPDTDFEMSYSIISYKLSLLHDKNRIYIEPVKGKGRFSNNPGIMKIIEIAHKGDKAIFEEIIAKDANGRIIELAPIILKLY